METCGAGIWTGDMPTPVEYRPPVSRKFPGCKFGVTGYGGFRDPRSDGMRDALGVLLNDAHLALLPFCERSDPASRTPHPGSRTPDPAPRAAALRRARRRVRFGQEGANLPAELVLDHFDLAPCVEHAKPEFIRHGRVLAEQRSLVGAKALVNIITEFHVHPGFPEVHPARLEHAADECLLVDLQVKDQVRRDRKAVQIPHPCSVHAAYSCSRHCGKDVAV